MLKGLRDFLCGWRYVTIDECSRAAAMDLLYQRGIPFVHRGMTADGGVCIRMRERASRLFLRLAEEECLTCTAAEGHGLPVVLTFLRRRPMLLIGALLAGVWLWYSARIVWDIRIEGNTKTSYGEITEVLDSLGFGIGTYIPSVNFNDLHARYQVAQQDIAWLSIYMNGTVAEVQVREMWQDERYLPEENVYANITASCTGVVEEVNVFEGQAAVRAGDIVRPGQVLISGVVEKKDGGMRYEYASGEVICRVAVPIQVDVPSEREVTAYTGEEKRKKTVKIFKNSINLFGKGGIAYATYDKISTMEQVCPFGLVTLPVWIEETVYRETTTTREVISPDDAAAEAMSELSAKMKDETAGGELVGREISMGFSDGVYSIRCLLTVRRDIGVVSEFTADGSYAEEAPENLQ